MQNASGLRLFAPKLFDQGATLFLKFLKLILVWRSNYLISFLVVNPCLKGLNLETFKKEDTVRGKYYGNVDLVAKC